MKLYYTALTDDNGVKLKTILKNRLYISNSLLIKLKDSNAIFVNDIPVFVNKILKENDLIIVDFDCIEFKRNRINCYDAKLNILYEDEYLLIVDKPCNLEIHSCLNNYDKTLANIVMNYYTKKGYNIDKVHILTRLDKDTSGICIIAKNEYIQNLFEIRKEHIHFIKEYTAIVNGIVEKNHDIIENNIARHDGSIILRQVALMGSYAKTEYFVLKRNIEKNYTILSIILHTGRTHQIRVHMANLGHILLRRYIICF
ncbi:MAG: RluA family pseudouridine synthase [Clostridia bacterium]